MYAFNSAAIFLPGHPYIESTTVLSDNQKEDEYSGVYVSWRLTTLANLSVDVSDVFSHELSRTGVQ